MKILHILDHSTPLHSGYTFRTLAILAEQHKLGWQTFHITSAKQYPETSPVDQVDGLTFYRSPAPNGLTSRIPFLNQWAIVKSLADRLDQIIPEIKPDILHAHSPALNGLAALKMSKKYHIPMVYECRAFWEDAAVDHGSTQEGSIRYRLSRALESYVFKQAHAITTICEGLRTDIIGRGVRAEKITVIPNAVDIDKFTVGQSIDLELKNNLGLSHKIVLGFIGSFYAYEGLLLLLDALPAIIAQQPEVRVLLVGGGFQLEAIKNKIKTLKLDQYVILTGRVPHEHVQQYYNLIDIFVYPRLSMRLTELVTPLKPLEAMAQGRLVVASDIGGHRELIEHKKTGYLFQADDPNALAATIIKLIAEKSNWPILHQAGRHFVEHERNWQISVANYQSVYQLIIN